MVIVLPEPKVLFGRLQYDARTEAGGRGVFQMLVTDLVTVRCPTANEVAGPGGGDWGIDTYVGRLDGTVVVWQSKFFLDWKGEDQRGQVRDSFNRVMAKASQEGFRVDAWTLCVPCVLPPAEQKWFDTWAAKNRPRTTSASRCGTVSGCAGSCFKTTPSRSAATTSLMGVWRGKPSRWRMPPTWMISQLRCSSGSWR